MSTNINVEMVAQLRALIAALEREQGLEDLSPTQLDVLCAIRLVCDSSPDAVAETRTIRSHPIIRRVSQPTFHRALRVLLDLGYVAPARGGKTKRYVIPPAPGDS